jgi:HEAT repeat protein
LGDEHDIATLARIISDPDIQSARRTHRYGALALGMIPTKDAVASTDARNALLSGIERSTGERDKFAFFEANCAYALAMRNDRSALPKLLDIRRVGLAAKDARNSIHASILGPMCYAMAALGDETVLPEITEHLRGRKARDGGNMDTSWCACHALSRIQGEPARQLLREAARDDRNEVRRVALGALGTSSDSQDTETEKLLRETLSLDSDPVCRWMAAISLSRVKPASAELILIERWGSAPAADRACLAVGLGLCARATGNPKVREFLSRALDDANDLDETVALCLACGIAQAKAAHARLAKLAGSSHAVVVTAYACYGLGLLGATPDEIDVLHEVVARPGDYLSRREAALALGMLRDRSVITQLRELVASEQNADVDRAGAVITLGRVGDDTNIELMLGVLSAIGTSTQLRACVIHALGLLLDRTGESALARIAADNLWFGLTRGVTFQPIYDIDHLVD